MSSSRLADALLVAGLVVTVGVARFGPTVSRAAAETWDSVRAAVVEFSEPDTATFDETTGALASFSDPAATFGGERAPEPDARSLSGLAPLPQPAPAFPSPRHERLRHEEHRHDVPRSNPAPFAAPLEPRFEPRDRRPEVVFLPPAPFGVFGGPAEYPGPPMWGPCDPYEGWSGPVWP